MLFNEIHQKIIKHLIKHPLKSEKVLVGIKRKFSKEYKIKLPTNPELLLSYHKLLKKKKIKKSKTVENLLRKRAIRTLSGIAPITVLTKPYPCPGKCIYCPSQKGMPKSYLSNEPAVMRAVLCQFDPYKQVQTRIKALEVNGHPTDKIELIVLGGTWSYYPKKYQTWFIKRCFEACNFKKVRNLFEAQKQNEKSRHRIVGLTLETRPDYITKKEILRMRQLGCTRVELGVQHTDDSILKLNKRGHTVKETRWATRLLKEAGFKVTYHLMLNLPGSTSKKDYQMFKDLFSKEDFQPDQIKIYPCIVTKDSKLYKWYQKGKFKPYSTYQLINLLIKIKSIIPPWVRIIRVIRDIPSESIIDGNKITNLRQIIYQEMERKGKKCRCIRCREIGHVKNEKLQFPPKADLPLAEKIKKYKTFGGKEYFLSFEDKKQKVLYAFLRLRIPDKQTELYLPFLKDAALVRELHTYGQMVPLSRNNKIYSAIQHKGLGKKLMQEVEKISRNLGFKKIAVISGVGVREYYRKLGYKLENTYMVKRLGK